MSRRSSVDDAGRHLPNQWGLDVEERFIHMLLDANSIMSLTNDMYLDLTMPDIATKLKRQFRRLFTEEFVTQKFHELKQRHDTMKAVVTYPNIFYEPASDAINVPISLQSTFVAAYPLAERYSSMGEGRFDLLFEIFKDPPKPTPPCHNNRQRPPTRCYDQLLGGEHNPIILSESSSNMAHSSLC